LRIYLLRHAIAATRDARRYPDDFHRPLTREGRRRMASAALGLKAIGVRADVVLSSPLTRARETARIVARSFRPRPVVRLLRPLAPGGRTAEILQGLATLSKCPALMLVGHEPDLSRLAAELLLPGHVDLPIEFKKGGLCRIDFEREPRPGEGRLVFHLPPRILRRLAGDA
jgi:phosphohistidine phosphatase